MSQGFNFSKKMSKWSTGTEKDVSKVLVKEMQINIIMRCHLYTLKWYNRNGSNYVEKLQPLYTAVKRVK